MLKQLNIACTTLFVVGALLVPRAFAATEDEEAVKKTLIDWYAAFAGTDEAHYRTFLADDYVLLEHGELMDLDADVAMMKKRAPGFQRRDRFNFKSVTVRGDIAYTVYFLESDIDDDKMKRERKWLESAVLRRVDGRWRASLLHSTRLLSIDTPR